LSPHPYLHLRVSGKRLFRCLLLAAILPLLFPPPALGQVYEQVYGLIDIRSTYSDGDYSIDQLAAMAKELGFGALFVTDHDRMVIAYGFPPFRHLLRKKEELSAIHVHGAQAYLQAIRNAQARHPEVILIPGVETTPFYYWTGSPLGNDLTAHDHEKRLLVIGMNQAEDYRNMPILHNRKALRWDNLQPPVYLFLGAALLAIPLICWSGPLRLLGILVLPLSLLLMFNSDPLRTSPFNAYSGDQGPAPYQLVIDYVNDHGGMTFWNYPETASGIRSLGPIRVSTKPYPGMLQSTRGYTGFAALYGDNITLTEPGSLWDMTLLDYCRGYRKRPVWGIATADYHGEGKDGAKLGNFPTVFLVRENTGPALLKAMQAGRMYACQTTYPARPRLEVFSVSSPDGAVQAVSGEDIRFAGTPRIQIALSVSGTEMTGPVEIRLIRGGTLISAFEERLPARIEYEDKDLKIKEKTYYRIDMQGGAGKIVSNPIFVTREG